MDEEEWKWHRGMVDTAVRIFELTGEDIYKLATA
jgi:hypothetical protein